MDITTSGSTLALAGAFDVRSTWQVRNALYEHLAAVHGDVVVDLTDVDVIDVAAMKVLAMATQRAVREGRHVVLRGCGPSVRRMLHVSRLFALVEIESGPASA